MPDADVLWALSFRLAFRDLLLTVSRRPLTLASFGNGIACKHPSRYQQLHRAGCSRVSQPASIALRHGLSLCLTELLGAILVEAALWLAGTALDVGGPRVETFG